MSLLLVGQAVCGASRGLPKGEAGMGGTDGDGEGSKSGIDRHPTDEGGSGKDNLQELIICNIANKCVSLQT